MLFFGKCFKNKTTEYFLKFLFYLKVNTYISGGTYSLKSTPNDSFLRNFSWQFYLLLRVFARNLLREEIAEEILLVLCFDDLWPGALTLAFRLISQNTTY